jgi:hypothetical protein
MSLALILSLMLNVALILMLAIQRVVLWNLEQQLVDAKEEIAELERVNAMIGMGS